VLKPTVGVRREVRVLAEDMLGGDVLLQLHEVALVADFYVKRVKGLHVVEVFPGDIALAQR
jgi:hypothetical protein